MAQGSAGITAGIRSMVVPLEQELMLLPSSIIAEVVPYIEPDPAPANAPTWLLGMVPWRGQHVPLVSVEAFISGGIAPVPSSNSRVAIIKTLDATLGFQFYGLLTRQIPRLVTVLPETVAPIAADAPPRRRIAADLLLNGKRMMVPDVEALEAGLWAVLPI
ncbi:MAG TPA: chemotaxis protein CheW [Gammaproteobacteria bacterium]|nr:chemotaxis protein CheW [Gammaproteobacteria bacterium]